MAMTTGDPGSSIPSRPSGAAWTGRDQDPAGGQGMSKHASITELELEFAQRPQSKVYAELCEAYLAEGRLVEAMVVCRKGLKAHPEAIEARLLRARVFAAQKKHDRALAEIDELESSHGDDARIYMERGRILLDLGRDEPAVEALKRAVDLDPILPDPKHLLAARGIVYPEPPPPPAPSPSFQVPSAPDMPSSSSARPMSMAGGAAERAPTMPPRMPLPGQPDEYAQFASQSGGPFHGDAAMRASGSPSVRPIRLEGEDELEVLAGKMAEERPSRGRPATTFLLLGALLVLAVGVLGYRISSKRTTEAIGRLSQEAETLFNRDTYGSYMLAAQKYEDILKLHDADHALTLGKLAYVYAILVGEHGEATMRDRLDKVMARALEKAPDVSFTVAAHGLAILYEGKDRQAAAKQALDVVAPVVTRVAEMGGGKTHADLTLAILKMELGDYEEASRLLGHVKQVLPGSVRAKVWHARAAFRASRFETAEAAFSAALRAEPDHPGARAGRALVRLERGVLASAVEDLVAFDAAYDRNQKDVSRRDAALAEYARSEIARSAGDEAKARGAYDQAVRFDPGNADFPYGLGRWLLRNQRAEEALVPLNKAVTMEPTRWSFLVELAEAEMEVSKFDSAEQHIETALQKAPDYLPAALAKARLLRRTSKPTAEAYIKGLLDQWPSAKVEVSLELGLHYASNGRYAEARKALEDAIGEMSGRPKIKQAEVLIAYGKLTERMGERSVAEQSYRNAAEFGELEGWYRLAFLLARGSREEREEAKNALTKYLSAGKSLRYSSSAEELLERLR
ncbi:MAG: tetratricopeptide repeat protein [Deltaproteobacteria bacterium]|nr:tetratricopeptide repeat protein [Deltaproteobacteria bacterium]